MLIPYSRQLNLNLDSNIGNFTTTLTFLAALGAVFSVMLTKFTHWKSHFTHHLNIIDMH